MYDLGHGIAMNSGSAFRWYRKAADKGLGVAMGNLGNCYALGKGTRPDLVQAFKWYTLAIDHVGQEQRAASTSNRNLVAGHMTRLQIAEGFMLARAWAAH
jgi:TPR repeat protein